MTLEIILGYLHFTSIVVIVSTLVVEHLLLQKEMPRSSVARLAKVDALYGLAALTLLGAGLTLWFSGVGKPTEFYSQNWIFHTKITLFGLVGLLSIYPTIFFLKNRKGNPEEMVSIPKIIFWMLRFELLLLFIIPLLGGLMAKGVGHTQ